MDTILEDICTVQSTLRFKESRTICLLSNSYHTLMCQLHISIYYWCSTCVYLAEHNMHKLLHILYDECMYVQLVRCKFQYHGKSLFKYKHVCL